MKNALTIEPIFHIRMEFSLQPSNIKGEKQHASKSWGCFLMWCLMFGKVPFKRIPLITKETKLGIKYTNSLYSGGKIGSIIFSIIPFSLCVYRWYLYELKNALSIHTKRHPNMQLISKVHMNGSDINPFMGESFERIGVGP